MLRFGVFTQDGLDNIEDTLQLADKHASDLQFEGCCTRIAHGEESELSVMHDLMADGQSFDDAYMNVLVSAKEVVQ